MKNNRSSVDGFIPRRSGSQLGDTHKGDHEQSIDRSLHTGETESDLVGAARENKLIGRSDIDQSLREIDSSTIQDKKNHASRRAKRRRNKELNGPPKNRALRYIKWFPVVLLIIGVSLGGYLVFKAVNASDSIFKGGFFDILKSEPLKQDVNGRSNFLILGTTDDDPNHPGGGLTDSILVLSIDQNNKNAYMFSVPRDLYVDYKQPCLSGFRGKINVYFNCSFDGGDEQAIQQRLLATQKFIGEIVGLDIQYGANVKSGVLAQSVDAVGGIDVDIQGSNGAPGILDRNFDGGCNFTCFRVRYDNGIHRLDGAAANFLSMARGDVAPTYGLANSNFDREKNQQKILIALKDKAISTGTLTNVSSVTKLIDSFGTNLRTNVQTNEIRTLLELVSSIGQSSIKTIDLNKQGEAQFTTRTVEGAGSVVLPAAGQFVYTELRDYIRKIITQEPYAKEEPHVTILNGSGTVGMAQLEADKLTDLSFIIDTIDNAPEGTYPAYTVYQIASDKPLTAAKLKSLYGVTLKTTTPPVSVVGDTDFLIIIGPAQ